MTPIRMTDALSPEEEARASATTVHVVWHLYNREDPNTGQDVTWGTPLSIHRTKAEADAAAKGMKGNCQSHGPCNLFALQWSGFIDADATRRCLDGADPIPIPPRTWHPPTRYAQQLRSAPLTSEEVRRANGVKVWTVYYEDTFHVGEARECYAVSVCLTEAEAAADVARRGPMRPGFDGHRADGPRALAGPDERFPSIGADVVRDVLRRIAAGESGPVPVS